jgi:hypothetical protein
MKVNIEIDCTPAEARAFMGLPDVEPLNDFMVAEMQRRLGENISKLQPEEMMRSWTAFGLQAQEQFRRIMTAATAGTTDKA